ncbi:TIGR00730 family Rossman fold protein [Streptomyces sp. NPDC093071]|uniref:LOG family protein n=1 Tax=Streptomyces sp. NPDC093071 TaxID=3366022 RepID=UPI003812C95A
MRRLAVFLASSDGHDPAHAALAASVGTDLARRGIGLVYGGGRTGLMGVVADAALKAGGEVVGVIPRSMIEREWAHEGVTELVVCDTMHERKAIMADRADAFAALPGGLGTLEEIFEVWSWRQLGFHTKPVGLLDAGGFWTPLLGALRGISDTGLLAASTLDDLAVAPDLPRLLEALDERLRDTRRPAHGARDVEPAPGLDRGLTSGPRREGERHASP